MRVAKWLLGIAVIAAVGVPVTAQVLQGRSVQERSQWRFGKQIAAGQRAPAGVCPPAQTIVYGDFADASALTLNGNATTAGTTLRLSPDTSNQRGTAFLTSPLTLGPDTSFTTSFIFRMSGAVTDGADGMTFMLQGNGANAMGAAGGGLAYDGLANSLAIELDTNQNGYDPNANHIGLNLDGDMDSVQYATPGFDLEDGQPHGLWIDYDGLTDQLEVYLGMDPAVKPVAPILTAGGIDLSVQIGTSAWIGFSAATGARYNDHDIEAWTTKVNFCSFTCSLDSECDDGAFCNGAETCQAGSCRLGSDPCPGQSCIESTDTCASIPSGWWDTAWGQRQRCRVDNRQQLTDLNDFPLLFRVDGGAIDYAATQNAGQDLRFIDADGVTPLAHEIDTWDESGTSDSWVKIPQISATSDQDFFWVYFDNPSALDSQQPAAVWSNGYAGVWHLQPDLADSTANGNDGSDSNTGSVPGPFGFAREFDGGDWVKLGNDTSLSITGQLSIEAWIRIADPDDDEFQRIVSKKNNWTESGGYLFDYNSDRNALSQVGGGSNLAEATGVDLDTNWHYVASRIDGTAAGLFVDGENRTTDGTVGALQTNNRNLYLGRRANGNSGGTYFTGDMDEVRISQVARSDDWIAAQYLSMTDAYLICEPVQSGCATVDDTCDGIDDDCDGLIDEDVADVPTTCGVGACASAGVLTCSGGVLVDTCSPGAPLGPDTTCDSVDDDCDGSTDEDGVCGLPAPRMETGRLPADGTRVTVPLINVYIDPVVVTTVNYLNNDIPVVSRVSNVGSTSFDVRLQNPAGLGVAAEEINYLVMEKGSWLVDGFLVEAQTYTSTLTDENDSWIGEAQSYAQAYSNPVVVGQVMTENDPNWSVFWCRGSSATAAADASNLFTGKTVCEDPLITRADETVGFIVFEAGHGRIGGVEFEAALGRDTVQGVDNGPPYFYTFAARFDSAPEVAVASVNGIGGNNGAWVQTHGTPQSTRDQLFLSLDEDQFQDAERSHTTERVSYVVFETEFSYEPQPCTVDADCDDTLFCTGIETCGSNGFCQAGTDPCFGNPCDELAQTCDLGPQIYLETLAVLADGSSQTVPLTNSYVTPVVVCTVQIDANTLPVVPRVSNVTSTSFDLRLQNPSDLAVNADTAHCMVVEEGAWVVDGVKINAMRYDSGVTAENNAWIGNSLTYGQVFSQPVVLGQVMSENDPDWSVFWCQGGIRTEPPTFNNLIAGKTVCEDPDITRNPETIGIVVLESGHGLLGGVEYEAGLSPDIIEGMDNSPPYLVPFNTSFGAAPVRALASLAGIDGGNGGWAVIYGSQVATRDELFLVVDEDQVGDSERVHITEQAGYLALAGDVVIGPGGGCATDFDCDDGNFCNGVDVCVSGVCDVIPIDCDDPFIDP